MEPSGRKVGIVTLLIAANPEALLLAEATNEPVDLSQGARAKPSRSREQVLVSRDARIAAAVECRAPSSVAARGAQN